MRSWLVEDTGYSLTQLFLRFRQSLSAVAVGRGSLGEAVSGSYHDVTCSAIITVRVTAGGKEVGGGLRGDPPVRG